jgi:hypothetical protein
MSNLCSHGHGLPCTIIDGKFESYMELISQYFCVRTVIAIAGFKFINVQQKQLDMRSIFTSEVFLTESWLLL